MTMMQRSILLQDRQRLVIDKALTPPTCLSYSTSDGKTIEQAPWQVLILDAFANDMLTALLNPGDLRRHGVTLRTQVDAPRGGIPDVFANYILSPSPENVAWLLKDIQQRKLYDRVSVAFTGSASAHLLAAFAAQISTPSPVVRVLDLHSSFISLEQNLFTLGVKESYTKLRRALVSNDQNRADFVEFIASGLLSVFASMGVLPIIRCPPVGCCAAVAYALDAKLRENIELFKSLTGPLSFRRPLLLLFERDIDFNAMLHHTWTYQALIHDCFDLKLNSLHISSSSGRDEISRTMDRRTDSFWAKSAGSPFPEVAQEIEAELKRYRDDVEAINKRAGDEGSNKQCLTQYREHKAPPSTSDLASVIASLPGLAERKSNIDSHTNIATAVLDEINKRALDALFELETRIMNVSHGQNVSNLVCSEFKAAVMDQIRGTRATSPGENRGQGTPEDKLRLFLIFYLAFGSQLTEEDMSEFRSVLKNSGISCNAVDFIQSLKDFRHKSTANIPTTGPVVSGTGSKRALVKGIISNVFDRGYRSITNIAKNAKDLIIENQRAMVCARILSLFLNDRSRTSYGPAAQNVVDDYLLLDPKVDRAEGETIDERQKAMVYSDAVVFVVGGGNYVEYEDVIVAAQSLSAGSEAPNVIYGTTELLNGNQFLSQLSLRHG